ncbi:MAG: hypothetical protein ABFQ89_04175 [Chloroflexota bacterium]
MKPIFRSDGEVMAVEHQGHLYSVEGDWLGEIRGHAVITDNGRKLGYLSPDQRLLNERTPRGNERQVPGRRQRILHSIPMSFKLPPMFKNIPFHIIDVFEEHPNLVQKARELRPDIE